LQLVISGVKQAPVGYLTQRLEDEPHRDEIIHEHGYDCHRPGNGPAMKGSGVGCEAEQRVWSGHDA
jgi:hypothetical protein